jgi:hypothetical protein
MALSYQFIIAASSRDFSDLDKIYYYCKYCKVKNVSLVFLSENCSPPPLPPPPPTPIMVQVNYDLDSINHQADLDFFTAYNGVYVDNDINDDPYFGVNLSSCYHTNSSLADLCSNVKSPIYLSINIQSLLSKYE